MKMKKTTRARILGVLNGLVLLAFLLSGASAAEVSYDLIKADTDPLYPAPGKNGYPDDTREIIRAYLLQSLKRDQIAHGGVQVDMTKDRSGQDAYRIRIMSSDPKATQYPRVHAEWLSKAVAGRALSGIRECKEIGSDCWNPLQGTADIEWEFFLPLGLPMVAQRAIMLLHYPPYASLKDGDYLKNATLERWERLLRSVGVPERDVSLYETIVDIIPIAAPGSGQSAYLPTFMATYFFDYAKKDRAYVSALLKLLADPPTNPSRRTTRPVIVFGGEATSYWLAKYADQLLKGEQLQPYAPERKRTRPQLRVLDVGSVKLDPMAEKSTPFMIANHPIAAVYADCNTEPTIVEMVTQDLTTACFARKLGADPGADPKSVREGCAPSALPRGSTLICANARIDKLPFSERFACERDKQQCWDLAVAWCQEHNNDYCAAARATK